MLGGPGLRAFHTRCVSVPRALCRGRWRGRHDPALLVLLCLGRQEDREGRPCSGRDPSPAHSQALLPGDPRLRSPGGGEDLRRGRVNLSRGALLQGCAGPGPECRQVSVPPLCRSPPPPWDKGHPGQLGWGQQPCLVRRASGRVLACEGTWSWDPASGCLPGTLPRPSLRAEPGSVIALGSPGTLWCQGTLEAQECRLYREGIPEPWDRAMPLEPGNKVKFSIPLMAEVYAGRYSCVCLSAAGWSEPSAALELRVSGGPEPSSPSHPQPGSPAAPAPQDHSLENLIRMGVAGLVLLGLGLLLAEAWYSQRRTWAAGQW
uniref:Uncharacterized protein n=1 Tax=Oryctolagus cuniculus TaxID=9986 RepID=A0A5F9CP15_RABIT